jgi:putative spermidine/putrescine transport system ATP-binding protein
MDTTIPVEITPPGGRTAGRHVDVRHIWKAYTPGNYVVRDASFTLQPGEFLTLLGPSGSGKTSTLMMVAGFETPNEGQILVNGNDVASLPPERRNFGVVFQGYALFPHMNVLDNVEFPLRMKHVPRGLRRRRAMDMLDRVGLTEFATRRPRELSGGQQQRVALARALVFEPDALLLDEPLGALDRKLREQLQVEIKEIQRRVGISILFVTHDQDEAMTMSDRIAVMTEGEIAQIGTPSEVYLHPSTSFVASFLGETNLLPVICHGIENDQAVVRFGTGMLGRARLPQAGAVPRTGQSALVSLRPERIRLFGAAEPAGFSVDGVMISHTFLGRHTRSVVQALGQELAISTMDLTPALCPHQGSSIRLGWNHDDAQLLADSRSTNSTGGGIGRSQQ